MPPLLAGRDSELKAAESPLADLGRGVSPSQDLLFYGPRGNGKTTLLLELERRAQERGFRVETLPVSALTGPAALVRVLQERAGVLGPQVTGVQIAGSGATTAPRAPTEDLDALLSGWIRRDDSSRPLVIVLDEAQVLVPDCARPFFEAVQRAKSRPLPFLVLAAGTPDAPRRIFAAGTFNERGFAEVPVGRLTRPDTMAAVSEPARAAGRPIAEEAASLLAEESQDYPYFVQLLGSAAWEAADSEDSGAGISLAAARRGATVFRSRAEQFYARRYREARARRIAPALGPLARLVAENDGRLTNSQLDPFLRQLADDGVVPCDELTLEQELSDLGVLWEARAGVWEMGIPSFADYLLRHG